MKGKREGQTLNRKFFTSAIVALSLVLAACTDDRAAADFAARAGDLVRGGDKAMALEVLRTGIYRHPDDYELNIMMSRTLMDYYTDLRPHAPSRYLARYYLKRAASVAPDSARAAEARAEYERIREAQR